jgi:hypothetical protein
VTRQSPTTTLVAILGGDSAVVENALALLLEGSGYNTKLLEASPPALADGLLEGIDVLLLTPGLSSGVRDVLLSVVRGNPKTAAMPVLTLSTAPREALSDQACMVLLWPTRLEDLRKAIEAALKPATSGKDSPLRSLGDELAPQQENAPDQPQPERYYSEYIHLPVDEDLAHVTLRGIFYARSTRGWKLVSATKEPSADVLRLEWDTLGASK